MEAQDYDVRGISKSAGENKKCFLNYSWKTWVGKAILVSICGWYLKRNQRKVCKVLDWVHLA
jgi:hypothetical protein